MKFYVHIMFAKIWVFVNRRNNFSKSFPFFCLCACGMSFQKKKLYTHFITLFTLFATFRNHPHKHFPMINLFLAGYFFSVYGTLPNPLSSTNNYKMQPGKIEDFTPGHSSATDRQRREVNITADCILSFFPFHFVC